MLKVGDVCTNGYDTVVIVRILQNTGKNNIRGVVIKNGSSPTITLSGVGRGYTSSNLTLLEDIGGFKRHVANHAMGLFNNVVSYKPHITYKDEQN